MKKMTLKKLLMVLKKNKDTLVTVVMMAMSRKIHILNRKIVTLPKK